MYRNKINNTIDNDYESPDIIYKKFKDYLILVKSNEIAYKLLLCLKYNDLSRSYNAHVNDEVANSEYLFNDFERKKIVSNSKKILEKYYNVKIENEDPLILASNVPFDKIDDTMMFITKI